MNTITRTQELDMPTNNTYNQTDVERIIAGAVGRAIALYEARRTILENCMQECDVSMPLPKGDNDMNRRQKLTINGVSQWRSFGSIQELVDMVTAAVKADCEQKSSQILFKDYMLDWYHRYKERELNPDTREGYKSIMKVHIIPEIGDIPISDITVADVQRIMDKMKSASYAKQTKSIINLVMDAAISDELYHHPNPTKDKRIVMPTTARKREPVVQGNLFVFDI